MTAVLLLGFAIGTYFGFVGGAEWARRGSQRRAGEHHQRALEHRQGRLRQLEELERSNSQGRDAARPHLVALIKEAEQDLQRAIGASDHAFAEATEWMFWLPWAEDISWHDVRSWWRTRRFLARGRKDWQREVSEPLSDTDRLTIDEVKLAVLRDRDSEP
jgi:hypothetical protein